MNHNTQLSNTYLAQWLADEITDADLQKLVSDVDYIWYQKIKNELTHYSITSPNEEDAFSKVKQKLATKKHHQKNKIWYSGIVATLLMLIGLISLFFLQIDKTTEFGHQNSVSLSDQSTVYLNANSQIKYPYLFRYNRVIHLKGEAFFEVSKNKGTFIVHTDLGKVKVLGTSFNVVSHDNYFEVICYTGKVEVTSNNNIILLKAGQAFRVVQQKTSIWTENIQPQQKPFWLNGTSDFKSVPYFMIIQAIENQYNVKIQYPDSLHNVVFSGQFTHVDLDKALQSVCIPLNKKYQINKDTVIISE